MKKILLLSSLLIGSLCIIKPASAQFHLSVNVGVQPAWGPVGYDYAEYYYLPEIESYYSVADRQFIYCDRGNWVYSSNLPGNCSDYDLYSGYKVVINERNPWMHFNDHRMRYAPYRFRHDQVVIRDNRGYGRGYGGNYGRPFINERNRGFEDHSRDWNNDRERGYNNNRGFEGRNDRGRDGEHRDNRGYNNNDHNNRNDRRDHDHGNRGGRW